MTPPPTSSSVPNVYRAETMEFIYETICETMELNWDLYTLMIEDLCTSGLLERIQSSDDLIMYKAQTGLGWETVNRSDDPIHRQILLQLIENPKCFFVLFNTQKGKLRISGQEMARWAEIPNKRVVSFLVVDNDRTLSEQSVNGLFGCFRSKPPTDCSASFGKQEPYNVRIFELSSNNKTSLREIVTYIDAYAYNPSYPMPLVVVLANNKQIEKLLRLLMHIDNHVCENLCAGVVWDEADKTYPRFRKKDFMIGDSTVNYLQFVDECDRNTIFRTGFVTATEGDLIEELYPECSNSYHHPVVIDPTDQENYFAFNHPEALKTKITVSCSESNNTIARRVLREHSEHFSAPLKLRNGAAYHHKIIINANASMASMTEFAKELRLDFDVMTFNMNGVTLFTADSELGKKYSARKQNLNRLLFYIYKMNNLENRPIIIMGRRKVDRGLGFHYAPRSVVSVPLSVPPSAGVGSPLIIPGQDGDCHTDGIEGLVWTDMIIGNRIVDVPSAVQKAGRGAGIIRQCPQYPGSFTYWVDNETSRVIERHYNKVDMVNELQGSNTIQQAVHLAEASLPVSRRNHSVSLELFRVICCPTSEQTIELTKKIVEEVLVQTFRTPQRHQNGRYKTSLNAKSDVVGLIDAINNVPGAYGTQPGRPGVRIYRRFFPCYLGETLCCVIPLIDPTYTESMKRRVDEICGDHLLVVPQEGEPVASSSIASS